MKVSIKLNTLENYISNQEVIEIMEGLNDPFYGKFVKEDMEVSMSLRHVGIAMTGYGHWKISVQIEFNGEKATFTKTTTDSQAVDNFKTPDNYNDNGEKENGYVTLFSECMNANEDKVYELLDTEDAD